MYLLIFYEIRALTLTGYNNSYLFTIKSLKVSAIFGSHRCSFHEDEIAANDVKEIKTSNEFKRLVMHLPCGYLKKKKEDVSHCMCSKKSHWTHGLIINFSGWKY